jgi:signal transduction histidine kinase
MMHQSPVIRYDEWGFGVHRILAFGRRRRPQYRYNQVMPQELQIPSEIDLTAFLSKEAHDLKSPFNRALGFIKLVLDGFDGPIPEQAEEDLTVAYKNTQYTIMMMDALVDIARLRRRENDLVLDAYPVDFILKQTISAWKRKYHKSVPGNISYYAPEVQILADEIMIRQCISHWVSYVIEFVLEPVAIDIHVVEQSETCLFTIRSNGRPRLDPPECDLTLFGFVARGILNLHQGVLILLEKDDEGALVKFSLLKA